MGVYGDLIRIYPKPYSIYLRGGYIVKLPKPRCSFLAPSLSRRPTQDASSIAVDD